MVRSALQRLYRTIAAPDAPPSHLVLEPLVETGDSHTRLCLMPGRIRSYFTLAGIEPPASTDLTITVYDAGGLERHRDTVSRHSLDRTLVWDSRERMRRVTGPVEG